MTSRITAMLASAALGMGAGSAFAQEPAAAPTLMPAMTAPLSQNPAPLTLDLGPLGDKVHVTGVLSGLGLTQDNAIAGDQSTWGDLSNAQVFVNKSDGVFQYFVQVGAYSLPALGAPYAKASTTTAATYDLLPQAFVKIAPAPNLSVQAGKLPTLIGAEYTFSFENGNIERGLLWGQEPAVSRGVQANYSTGPLAFSLAWTDGFYSNRYDTVSGAVTWTIDPSNVLIVSGQGNARKSRRQSSVTPLYLNNEQIYNLIYTHVMGRWSVTPYLQYTSVPEYAAIGAGKETHTWGGALLATYAFGPNSPLAGVSLPMRAEYISASGSTIDGSVNVLYGPGSSAWSLTLTPTYTFQRYFVRGEVSYVQASGVVPGLGFGSSGQARSQTRGLIELGVLF